MRGLGRESEGGEEREHTGGGGEAGGKGREVAHEGTSRACHPRLGGAALRMASRDAVWNKGYAYMDAVGGGAGWAALTVRADPGCPVET